MWIARPAGRTSARAKKISGYPTIKYGDPNELQQYSGGRDFDALKDFASTNLGPSCGPAHVDLCDDTTKETLTSYLAMDDGKLAAALTAAEQQVKDAEAKLRREWTVHIEREEGTKLGAAIGPEGDNFQVNNIQDGALKTFNAENPGQAVQAGDQITKVNAATGVDAMKEEFKKNPVDLLVVREPTAEDKDKAVKDSGLRFIKSVQAFKSKGKTEL